MGAYMGTRKILLPCSLLLSAVNGLLILMPFVFVWLIAKTVLTAEGMLSETPVWRYAVLALCVSLGNVLFYFLALMLSHLAAFRVETNLRRSAMSRLMQSPLGLFDKENTGRMRKIIDEDASSTHTFVAHILPDLAASIVSPLGVLVLLFIIDWRLGLACLIPLLGIVLVMFHMADPRNNKFQKKYLDAQERMSAEAVEYVRGIPVVKVFQQTIFSFKNFYDSIIAYRDLVTQYTLGWRRPMSAYTTIINSFAFFLVPVAILLIGQEGRAISIIADMFLFVLITPVISMNVMKIMYLNHHLFLANEAIERIEGLTKHAATESRKDLATTIHRYDITFENVSFRYEGAERNAVNDVSFTIPEGQIFALVGHSGGGKTTIARLIPRFWDVDKGNVCIGGVNVRDIDKKELMSKMAFVFQNVRLFKTTILENIKYGTPYASMEEIQRAIDLSCSREIIERLPQGLDTVIGAEGTYLSGGEQQRIILARAFLKNAPIVVLDEATAFADPENEHLIRQALLQLIKGKTVLMIAHRLTTIRDVDRILVIDAGRIAEEGTHDELIARNGLYEKMWNEYRKSIEWKI